MADAFLKKQELEEDTADSPGTAATRLNGSWDRSLQLLYRVDVISQRACCFRYASCHSRHRRLARCIARRS